MTIPHNPKRPSPEAAVLYDKLIFLGVKAQSEYYDGHKHVDIAIPDARIYIEVDDLHHFTNAEQILRDFKRDHFSDGDDFNTIHIPNLVVKHHLSDVARAIAEVVQKRIATFHPAIK